MGNIKIELSPHEVVSKDSYNAEPVVYCAHCFSLSIREVDGTNFCDKCGGTEMKTANIFEWEKMYAIKYGRSYINKK